MQKQREGNACLPGQVTSVGSGSPVLLETLGGSAEHARRHSPPKERDSWGFCAPAHAVPIQGLLQGVMFIPPAEGLVVQGAAAGGRGIRSAHGEMGRGLGRIIGSSGP